ncbi:MAG: YfiR family protein [Rubripirellula sp.]
MAAILISLCATTLVSTSFAVAQEQSTSREYKLKVAYLYNFSRYVTWPNHAFESTDDPFVIGILGNDPFGASIDSLARMKKVGGRTVVVKRFRSVREYVPCHILFVSGVIQNTNHEDALDVAEGNATLIIGEASGFAQSGGTVSFFKDPNGTIGFDINIDATRRQLLTFQAPVLKLANIVQDSPDRMVPR